VTGIAILKMSATRFQRLLLSLGLIAILAADTESRTSLPQRATILPPDRPGLLPVHTPDVEGLEAEVREQLLSLQNSTAILLRDPATSDQRLGEAYGLLGQIYHAYALTSPAEESYLNAHRLAPGDFRWAYLIGAICQQGKRAEEAIKHYTIVRRLRPDYLGAPVNLGNLYLQQNRLEEARRNFNEALAISSKCAAAYYGLGQVALSQRLYAEAARYFERALADAPGANRIHYALAMSYRGLGDIEKAQAHIQLQGPVGVRVPDPLVERLPDLIRGERVHLVRGRVAFDALRFSEAAEQFRKALAARPESIPARVNLGSALAALGDVEGAMQQYRESLRIDPASATSHYNLGVLLAKRGAYALAIPHLQSALKLNPEDGETRFLLARELRKARRLDEALAELSRVVDSDSGNEEALLEEVSLLTAKRQYGRAVERLEKSYALFPQRGRTVVMLAFLLATRPEQDLRDGARALELARRAYEATSLVNHGAIVAMALAELGRCAEAAEWQRRMIAAAEREGKAQLVEKLKSDLQQYEKQQACRPRSDQLPSNSDPQQERRKP
jgi:tetratricopeptide (TPR) repeat protein